MRRPALALLPLLVSAALLLPGCGGGGGSDPGGGGGPDVSELASVRTDATLSGSGASIDATNILVGERVQFRLTGVLNGQRRYVNVTGWTTTVPANVGTISDTGVFSAGNATGSGTVSVTVKGVTYTGSVTVKGGAIAIVSGRIRLVSGSPASGIEIQLLNSTGGVVGTGFSTATGAVRIATLPTATRLNLNFDSVDPAKTFYVRQFFLGGTDYSTVIPGCTAPLPTLAEGGSVTLPTDIVVYGLGASTPPPPPDGCDAP